MKAHTAEAISGLSGITVIAQLESGGRTRRGSSHNLYMKVAFYQQFCPNLFSFFLNYQLCNCTPENIKAKIRAGVRESVRGGGGRGGYSWGLSFSELLRFTNTS